MKPFWARKTVHEHFLQKGNLAHCPCAECRARYLRAQEAELARREAYSTPTGYPEWLSNQQCSRAEARWTVESSTEWAAVEAHALGVLII